MKLAAKETLTPKLATVAEKAPIATADPFAEPPVSVHVTSSSVATHAPNAADTQWLHRSAPSSNGTESLTVPDHVFALPLSITLAPGMLEEYVDGGDQLHFLGGGEQPLASLEASLDGGEPSGSEHLFRNALQALFLGCPYENSVKADDAFIRFTQVGCSAMHQKEVFVPKRESSAFVKTVIYRCGVDPKKCPFRIKLSVLKSGLVTFDLCGATGAAQSHNEDEVGSLKQSLRNDKHVGHELQRPVRATSLVQNVAKRLEREVREDGRSGSDHTNAVICKAAALGIDLSATAVNALKRQLCMEKLHSRILKCVPMDSMFKLGETLIDMATTSESSLHASAVLGILVTLQQQQPDAYIRVVVVDSCIKYTCFATEKMRIKGIYKFACFVYSDHVSTNYGGALLIQYTSYRESVW